MVFKIFKTSTNYPQKYWWVIVSGNGKILASSEMYYNKADCENAIYAVKACAENAEIIDLT